MSNEGRTRYEGPRDAGSTVGGTTYEGGSPATASAETRHESAGDPSGATRYEGTAATDGATPQAHKWVVVPQAILDEYEYLEDISSAGAQADIVKCRHHASGDIVAMKIYRSATGSVDESALAQLRLASADHVVPIRSLGSGQGRIWEVQEHFALGSLQALFDRHPNGLPLPLVREILVELTAAIAHIHTLGIIHRDLKPDNVFVRSMQPLDLVLGDFGVARQQAVTQVAGSIAGTTAYMAPESTYGLTSRPGDWWALGIIVHEALTSRHLFAVPSGQGLLNDPQIRVALGQGKYAIAEMPDERWTLLVRGLLTRQPEDRWGETQVRAWLRGESPAVVTDRVSDDDPAHRPTSIAAFPFAGRTHATPSDLAAAFRAESTKAAELLADPRASERLRTWLGQHGLAETVDAIRRNNPGPDRALVSLQAVMAPSEAPVFRSVRLDARGLEAVAGRAAKGDSDAVAWIRALRTEQILGEWAAVAPGAEALGVADERLRGWWRGIDQLPSLARNAVAAATDAVEGLLLKAALDDASRRTLAQDNAKALGRLDVLSEAFLALARPVAADTSETALGARTLFALQMDVERTAERGRRVAASRERVAIVRRQAWRNGREGARRWFWWSLPLAAVVGVAATKRTGVVSSTVQELAQWWAGLLLLGAVLWVFRQRGHTGVFCLAAGCVGIWWAGQFFEAWPDLPMSLWVQAFVGASVAGAAGWAGGFIPEGSFLSTQVNRVNQGLTRAGASLLGALWLALLTRAFAIALPTQANTVFSDMDSALGRLKTYPDSWLRSLVSMQPSWMMPTGAVVVFVLAGLVLVLSRTLRWSPRATPWPRLGAVLVLLFVVLGNYMILWPAMVTAGLIAIMLTVIAAGRWLAVRDSAR